MDRDKLVGSIKEAQQVWFERKRDCLRIIYLQHSETSILSNAILSLTSECVNDLEEGLKYDVER